MRLVCRATGLDRHKAHKLFSSCKILWRVAGLPNPGGEASAYMNCRTFPKGRYTSSRGRADTLRLLVGVLLSPTVALRTARVLMHIYSASPTVGNPLTSC